MFKIHNQQKDFTEIIDQILKMILNGKLTIVITIGSVLRGSFSVPLGISFFERGCSTSGQSLRGNKRLVVVLPKALSKS